MTGFTFIPGVRRTGPAGRSSTGEACRLEERTPAFLTSAPLFVGHYLRQRAGGFLLLLSVVAAAAGCAVGVQWAMKLLVDAMASPDGRTVIWGILATFLGLIAVESVLWRLSGWLTCRVTIAVGVDMRLDLFDHLNGQPMRYFAENLAGSLGQRLTATAGNFGALTNTVVWRILPPAIDFLGAMVVFATIDPRMMFALGGFVVVVTTGLIVFGKRGRPLHATYAGHAGHVAGELVDVISNMWAVKAFSARQREWQRLAGGFETEAEAQRRSWMYTEKARVVHDVALWIMASTMLGWALMLWARGSITPGDVILVSSFTFRILHGSRDLAISLVDTAQQFGYVEDTLRILAQPRTVVDRPHAKVFQPRGGAISFRDVHFAYARAGGEAIHGLSVEIPGGQKVGIVGASGAGKSTLLALLQRLYDVDRGTILLDGQAIDQLRQDSLRAALAVVPQEITLFHRTVAENIRLGRPDATDDEVAAVARAANCEAFIRNLPDGFETLVGERGTKLSGGQRQRIGIARAFLKDAPVIVLDEATSALDTESELRIQQALVEVMADRTVVAVAHRLSTLAAFDRILVMENGRIVEDGSPSDLRRRNGAFHRMWALQAGGLATEPIV